MGGISGTWKQRERNRRREKINHKECSGWYTYVKGTGQGRGLSVGGRSGVLKQIKIEKNHKECNGQYTYVKGTGQAGCTVKGRIGKWKK